MFLARSVIPSDLSSTYDELDASLDGGAKWGSVSHIAEGGDAVSDNGLTLVWEPYLTL